MRERQASHELTDEDIARGLGLEGMSVVAAIKAGRVRPSIRLVPRLEDLLGIHSLRLLKILARDGALDVTDHIEEVYRAYCITNDEGRLVDAYNALQRGGKETQRVKLPGAMAFIVPDEE